jgi:hypothetical protein
MNLYASIVITPAHRTNVLGQLLEIARGVEYVHGLNVTHGNLKIVDPFLHLHLVAHSRPLRQTSSLTLAAMPASQGLGLLVFNLLCP